MGPSCSVFAFTIVVVREGTRHAMQECTAEEQHLVPGCRVCSARLRPGAAGNLWSSRHHQLPCRNISRPGQLSSQVIPGLAEANRQVSSVTRKFGHWAAGAAAETGRGVAAHPAAAGGGRSPTAGGQAGGAARSPPPPPILPPTSVPASRTKLFCFRLSSGIY